MAVLKELIEKPITGEWGEEGTRIKVLRTTNFTNLGVLKMKNIVTRNVSDKKIEQKKLIKGDIIIEKSGGSPTQPVGRVVYFDKEGDYLCNNFTSILRPKQDKVVPKYLHYLLYASHRFGVTGMFQNKTTGIINLQLPRYIDKLQIPLPPLPEQQRIANILDTAADLKNKTQALLTAYDSLAQSIFLDMFGDPILNEKKWNKVRFDELVSSDCPLTYGIVQPGNEYDKEDGVFCVRPVDLTTQYIKNEGLKKISPEISRNFKRTILKGGEILLSVRGSVGVISIADNSLNKANVTRGIVPIWFDKSTSNKLYFYYLYRTYRIQNQIKRLAKGATLIQINLKDLRELLLITPPIELQNEFAQKIKNIEQQKALAQQELQQAENLFNGLLQKAFKGEL